MKVALVYDWVYTWGGAERLLMVLQEIFPKAPLYTALYQPKNAAWARNFSVRTSFLNRLPFAQKNHRWYFWLMPLAFESFDFGEFDLVISVSSAAAKGIITGPKTRHINICLTPTRYLWQSVAEYFPEGKLTAILKPLLAYLRHWDKIAASRPDSFIAISREVQKRISRDYQRSSTVIYPPAYWPGKVNSRPATAPFFLLVSRLEPYKHVEVAVAAFNELALPLVIVGRGSQEKKLQKLAGGTIRFLKNLTDIDLTWYYQNCRAFIMPQVEDFGLSAIEAQSFGKPVIALGSGGSLETVIGNQTGFFFKPQTARALAAAVRRFCQSQKNFADKSHRNARRFTKEKFIKEFKNYLKK